MKLAARLQQLGTETAFAVSAEANAHKAAGNHVYPFHLGDMNIRTPDNIIAAAERAMHEGRTGYCPTHGIPELRAALAADINASHGTGYTGENVAVQPGGKPVIGKFILATMNPGDEALYPNPGYPIYESQIEFHGGTAVPYPYAPGEKNFRIDLDAIEARITDRTRLLIVNDLNNPTGAEALPEERARLAALAEKHNLTVLLDEAYFDIRYEGQSKSIVSEPGMEKRSVLLYTFSKKFAMTGWRLGAAVGPVDVITAIARLNVNDESCSNHFIQHAAVEALTGDQAGPRDILARLKVRRDLCVDLLNKMPGVHCYRPGATFYVFPDVTEAMAAKGLDKYEDFRKGVLRETGVSFCTRLHFGRLQPGENRKYIRFAYSGIGEEQIEEGLGKLDAYLRRG